MFIQIFILLFVYSFFRCFLERIQLETVTWSIATPVVITALIFFCVTQFVFFSLVPVILFESGATALQLALLSSDFLNVFIGMLNHRYKVIS